MKKRIVYLALFTVMTVVSALLSLSPSVTVEREQAEQSAVLLSEEAKRVVLADESGTDFTLYFSSDAVQADQALTSEISKLVYELYGVRMRAKSDAASKPAENEILIGRTNRPESEEFLEAITASVAKEEDLVWGFAFINGKLVYTANSTLAFDYGKGEFLNYLIENDFTVSEDLFRVSIKTREEYDAEIEADEELKRQKILNELKEKNAAFKQSDFGGAPKSMGTSPYAPPVLYPAEGVHPRIFITEDKIDEVLEIMKDPAYAGLVDTFWIDVNKSGCTDGFPIVEFKDPNDEYEDDYYRYDVKIISALQNKAFAYLLTGDEIYGYEAIVGAKNMIITLKYSTYIHMDLYHGASHVMDALAKIYDWCYDLLTEEDKNHFAAGVSNVLGPQMEAGMRFPPSGMNGVSGHGTGPQLLRDWIMICIAFFDEMPDWWEFVGGRFFEEYVPVINEHTKSGWVTQGTACYGPGKFYEAMSAAWLLYLSTGQLPYNEDGLKLAPYYVISHLQANGKYFQTGDGARNVAGGSLDYAYLYDVAAIFGDSTLTGYLYSITDGLNSAAKPDWGNDAPAAKVLAYISYLPEPDENFFDSIDTIQYFAHPAGTMTARNSWDEDGAVAYMKIGTMTMANHDIYDHGTFQIYYKGLLAATSGTYNKYGSNVHRYYLQSTVAHNGILVFNPAFASATPELGTDPETGEPNPLDVTNGQRYFYSGSQKRRGEAGTIENWLGGNYNMGEITGYDIGYSYEDGSAEFGYIAGEISSSYDAETVRYLERRMLTLFTSDPNYPMLFFTFDTVEATDAAFSKTYLLHTTKEPVIDEENMSADIREGEGRLFVQSLFGADVIEKVGGEGRAYWINGYYDTDGTYVEGKNCVDTYAPHDNFNRFWGRMQLRASGDATTRMLTAMFVTDAENEETPLFEKFSSDAVYGAKFRDIYTVFLTTRERTYQSFSFETDGVGLSKYYVSGIEAGTWKVSVDGVTVATVAVDDNSGFASFTAPSGNVLFTPTENVIGANGGKISYVTGGGILGLNVPYSYRNETATPLTTDVTRGVDTFLGWYTTPTYDEGTEITEIPAGHTGTVKIYAKWLSVFLDEDFSESEINLFEKNQTIGGIGYTALSKEGASFITKKDEDGTPYLEWTEGKNDPLMTVTDTVKNFAAMSTDDETVSYEVSFSRDGDNPIIPFHLRVMSNVEYGTGAQRVFGETRIFTVSGDGKVRLGSSGPIIGDISAGDILTVRIALDFRNETLTAYDENGAEMQSIKFTVPEKSGAPNGIEWRKLMKQYLAYIYPSGAADLGGSLRIYGIKISESNTLFNPELATRAIEYDTAGGTLAPDAPFYYSNEVDTPLPEISKKNAQFLGWYTTKTFDTGSEITVISKDTEGPVKIYAKWLMSFIDTDFSDNTLSADDTGNGSADGVDFLTTGKTGASAVTKTDANGKTYIEWVKGSSDTIMRIINNNDNFSTMSTGKVSYSFRLSKKVGAPILSTSQVVLQSNVAADGTDRVFGSLTLFTIDKNGGVIAPNGAEIAKLEDNVISHVNFTLDFENGLLTYYDATYAEVASYSFTAPEKSGAASTAEWQRLIRQYLLYFRANNNSIDPTSTLLVYGISIKEGDLFKNAELPDGNGIIYKTNGGTLPDGAPTEYDPAHGTLMPTDLHREGYVFGGWYQSSSLTGERTDYIPAGSTKPITVYAKWIKVVVNEDYSSSDVDVPESTTKDVAGIKYNAGSAGEAKPGSLHITERDGNGNVYLRSATKGKATIVCILSDSYNLSHFATPEISFEFDLGASEGAKLASYTLRLATSGGNFGEKQLLSLNGATGEVKLINSDKVIGTVGEGFTRLRICVSFSAETVSAYDEGGKLIDSISLGSVPTAKENQKQPESWVEWQKVAVKYLFYGMLSRTSGVPSTESSELLFDNLKIYDGNPFISFAQSIPNPNFISYVTGGGTLPEGAPTEYDPAVDTVLPTPEKSGSVFGGWYTSSTFEEGTRVEKIAVGTEGEYKIFAKWHGAFVATDFKGADINATSEASDTHGSINFVTKGKAGASFKSTVDSEGRPYLEWVKGSADSLFNVYNEKSNFSTMEKTSASYSLRLGKKAGAPVIASSQIVLESNTAADGTQNVWGALNLLEIDAAGNVICALGDKTVLTALDEDGITDVNFVIDFENGVISFYSETGEIYHSVSFEAPAKSGAESTAEWQKLIQKYMLYFRANDNSQSPESALLIYGITVAEGNIFE